MIHLKFKDFQNPALVQGIQKLMGHTGFSPKTAYNIARIASKFEQGTKHAQELYVATLKKHAILDEKGAIAPIDGPGTFRIKEESIPAWTEEYKEFLNIDFAIERHLVKLNEVEGVGLSAIDILALEPILTEIEEVHTDVLPIKE